MDKRGVLKKEVVVSLHKIEIARNSILSAKQKEVLLEANKIAEEIFAGSHGLTDNGYLVPLSEAMKKLPHPKETLFLNVGEAEFAGEFVMLDILMVRRRKWKYRFQYLHLHRKNGQIVNLEFDALGIKLFQR